MPYLVLPMILIGVGFFTGIFVLSAIMKRVYRPAVDSIEYKPVHPEPEPVLLKPEPVLHRN